ncbi:MAG: hypothetical protein HYX67_09680 [Candidatus Melainabacteria bacterium]|nr:hypothetical protein [Candidatus Melainabacteria bacterium]
MQVTLLALDHGEYIPGCVVILVFNAGGDEVGLRRPAVIAAYFNLLDVIFHTGSLPNTLLF